MRHSASLLLGSLLLPLLASCASPQAEPPLETITITLADTVVSVDRDSVIVDRSQSPVVRWVSVPADGRWIVAFGAATPFRAGKWLFHGQGSQADRQGVIDDGAALGEYKYWIFFADDDGDFHVLDPRLVIIDEN